MSTDSPSSTGKWLKVVAAVAAGFVVLACLCIASFLLVWGLTPILSGSPCTSPLEPQAYPPGGDSRAQAVRPRNMDMWMFYRGSYLRFATLFYLAPEDDPTSVIVAGPLVFDAAEVVEFDVFGAQEWDVEAVPGPGRDSIFEYPRYELQRDDTEDYYGIDILTPLDSPYITPSPENPDGRILSLGVEPDDYYEQIIVAVVFPLGTCFDPPLLESLQHYRVVNLDGWTAIYYDTTAADGSQSIVIEYQLGPDDGLQYPELSAIETMR